MGWEGIIFHIENNKTKCSIIQKLILNPTSLLGYIEITRNACVCKLNLILKYNRLLWHGQLRFMAWMKEGLKYYYTCNCPEWGKGRKIQVYHSHRFWIPTFQHLPAVFTGTVSRMIVKPPMRKGFISYSLSQFLLRAAEAVIVISSLRKDQKEQGHRALLAFFWFKKYEGFFFL